VGAAVESCVRVRDRIEPEPEWAAAYEERYATFRALYPALRAASGGQTGDRRGTDGGQTGDRPASVPGTRPEGT
ncbi:MAG: hypothetical protein M3321_04375, partial [Actinomycetota bacterium]|nr:hypothetical protein [Actinomycetota bacterium]